MLDSVLVDDLPANGYVEARVPVPDAVSVAAVMVLAVLGVRVAGAVRRDARERRALRALGSSGRGRDDQTVVEDGRVDAFAVSDGAASRIVVTTGMLALLGPAQRTAMIAHERAHLRQRHSVARHLVRLAAAANPTLIPMRNAVAFLCERHADECAAVVTDRGTVARAIAAAALGRRPRAMSSSSPALHRLAVTDRVRALMAPPVRRPLSAAPLLVALALLVAAVVDATADYSSIAASILR
jgi:Zn-dependent protease with chaperone function